MSGIVVDTEYGPVAGYRHKDVCVWKGVPFAKPPVGDLRYQPPQTPDKWRDPLDARAFGRASMQPNHSVIDRMTGRAKLAMDEDCLYLNIWSPAADDGKRPVMVWIHGGAFVTGSGSITWYDGTSFALNGDVVLVTVNYRLGALGMLYLEGLFGDAFAGSANLGLQDQIAALRFVRDNIAAFGGDPNRVTVFGESAGAASVGALLTAPAAQGLFAQAVMQSGSGALGVRTTESATATAYQLLEFAGVQPGDTAQLMRTPAQQLVAAGEKMKEGLPFGPVVDGMVLPHHPLQALAAGSARGVPVIVGVNRDEASLWTMSDPGWGTTDRSQLLQRVRAMSRHPVSEDLFDFYLQQTPVASALSRAVQLLTYAMFVGGMLRTADAQSGQSAPVWTYRFDCESTAFGGRLGACHAVEIPFVFNNLDHPGVTAFVGNDPGHQPVADHIHQAWISFARTGDPNSPDWPAWERYDSRQRAAMVFGANPHTELDPYAAEREAWEKVEN